MPLPPLPLLILRLRSGQAKEGDRCLYLRTFPSSEKIPVLSKEEKEQAEIVNELVNTYQDEA